MEMSGSTLPDIHALTGVFAEIAVGRKRETDAYQAE
jgi:hypothetical protein